MTFFRLTKQKVKLSCVSTRCLANFTLAVAYCELWRGRMNKTLGKKITIFFSNWTCIVMLIEASLFIRVSTIIEFFRLFLKEEMVLFEEWNKSNPKNWHQKNWNLGFSHEIYENSMCQISSKFKNFQCEFKGRICFQTSKAKFWRFTVPCLYKKNWPTSSIEWKLLKD